MIPSANSALLDPDLAAHARPGHGVPSQDPDPAAQHPIPPHEAAREAESVFVVGSLLAGMILGATVGAMACGAVGVVMGGSAGALAGALRGAATRLLTGLA